MRNVHTLSFVLSVSAAAALATGCADMRPRSSAMGAAPQVTVAAPAAATVATPATVVATTPRAVAVTTVDADMKRVLDAHASLNPQPIPMLTPEQARAQPTPADAVKVVLGQQGRSTDPAVLVPGVRSVDRMIPDAAGPIPARIYTPSGNGPFPVIVHFHGGGFAIADKEVYDGGARGLSKEAEAVVVSIDYRRAPEHKLPASWDDSLAAYRWALANAGSIGGDPRRVALAGESAGGNLAVATAVAARDARLPMPVHVRRHRSSAERRGAAGDGAAACRRAGAAAHMGRRDPRVLRHGGGRAGRQGSAGLGRPALASGVRGGLNRPR